MRSDVLEHFPHAGLYAVRSFDPRRPATRDDDVLIAPPGLQCRKHHRRRRAIALIPVLDIGTRLRETPLEPLDADVQVVVWKSLPRHIDACDEGHVEQLGITKVVASELVAPARRIEPLGFRTRGCAIERHAVEGAGETAIDEFGGLGVAAVDIRVVEAAALETRLAQERPTKVGGVEPAVAEHASWQRDEQRREPAVELQATEIAAIEETAAEREFVEAGAAEVDRAERSAMQRDDAFVVGLLRFAVLRGHCAPV